MKLIVPFLYMSIMAANVHASGWNDYELDIGDGYTVFRANSMDVCIGKQRGTLVLSPHDFVDVGPVIAYQMLNRFILTKNAGSQPRNLFEGDTFQDVDYEKEWFFIIPKVTNQPLGPYHQKEFDKKLTELGIHQTGWLTPRNPNFWIAFFGILMFIVIAIPFLAVKFFYISIPCLVLLAWRYRVRRRRLAVENESLSRINA